MRRFDCPYHDGGFVALPDTWTGADADRRDEMAEKLPADTRRSKREFLIALALAEDWGGIPGIDGKPEKWPEQFHSLDLPTIAWFSTTVLSDFGKCYVIPKNSLPPSGANQAADPSGSGEADG